MSLDMIGAIGLVTAAIGITCGLIGMIVDMWHSGPRGLAIIALLIFSGLGMIAFAGVGASYRDWQSQHLEQQQ